MSIATGCSASRGDEQDGHCGQRDELDRAGQAVDREGAANIGRVGLATPVRLFVAAYALFYVAQISAALLNGLGQSRRAFVAHAAGAAATLLVALPLAAAGGLRGAVWGGLVPAAVHAAASVLLLRRLSRPDRHNCQTTVETCVAASPQAAIQPA